MQIRIDITEIVGFCHNSLALHHENKILALTPKFSGFLVLFRSSWLAHHGFNTAPVQFCCCCGFYIVKGCLIENLDDAGLASLGIMYDMQIKAAIAKISLFGHNSYSCI